MARQGHSFVTADEVRVVYERQEGEPFNAPLRDVPADGRTLGEVVVRGNIVMKEVRLSRPGWRVLFIPLARYLCFKSSPAYLFDCSTSGTQEQRGKRSEADILAQVTSL
jgi:hypothetical protein